MDKQNIKTFSKLHRISLIIGALTIMLPILFWNRIPDTLPMHYNALGQVDNWSDKTSLILLFFVVALLMGVMSIAVYLVKMNMESKYSKDAEKSEMRAAYPVVILMNLVIQIMFAYMMFCCVTCRPLGTWFLPVFLIGTFAPIVCLIFKRNKTREKHILTEQNEQGVTYRTAVDWWMGLLLGGCEVLMVWLAIEPIIRTSKIEWSMLLLAVGMSILIVPLFGIKYVMYSEHMLVSMSIFGKVRIKYQDIVGVKKTHNPLSSAAMSLKRIQIDYVENGVHRMVLISPVRRKMFLEQLEEYRHES